MHLVVKLGKRIYVKYNTNNKTTTLTVSSTKVSLSSMLRYSLALLKIQVDGKFV